MFIRQENIIINTKVLPVITLQGSDIRFQEHTNINAAYTKLKFKTIKAADKAFNRIFSDMQVGGLVTLL